MENPPQFNTTTATVVLSVIVAVILLGALYFWLDAKGLLDDNSSSKQTTKTVGNNDAEIDTSEWKILPYYSDFADFVLYYPEDAVSIYISGEYQIYEGQSLVSVGTELDSFNLPEGHFDIMYYNDAGDTFDIWIRKKGEILRNERATESVTREFEIDSIKYIEKCYPDGSLMISCHTFYHNAPYIIELRTHSYNLSNYQNVRELHTAFLSLFHPLNTLTDNWSTYSTDNGGYEIKYPETEFTATTSDTSLSAYFEGIEGKYFRVLTITGNREGALDYWYRTAVSGTGQAAVVPREAYIDGNKCYFADQTIQDISENFYVYNFYCGIGNRLYVLELGLGDQSIDSILFNMIRGIIFSSEAELSKATYLFKDERLNFNLNYSSQMAVSETWFELASEGYLFEEITGDGLMWKNFSISYEKSDMSIEECMADDICIMYGSISEYSNGSFAGVVAYVMGNWTDYGSGINVHATTYILKHNGYLIRINVMKDAEGGNELIDDIVNSFTFL